MSKEHSYDRLCDYYRAKQEEKDMTHSKAKHEIGTRKEVIRFTLFPMIIESRFVWLRRYILVKEYAFQKEYIPDSMDGFSYSEDVYFYWKNVERKILRR